MPGPTTTARQRPTTPHILPARTDATGERLTATVGVLNTVRRRATPLLLAQAHADAVAALYVLAAANSTAVDLATIRTTTTLGFQRINVVAEALKGGRP